MVDQQQKGTALSTAMAMMSVLAAIATIIIMQQRITMYKSQLLFNVDRAYLYTNGAVAWGVNLLEQRALAADTVMVITDELPPTATPNNDALISATLEDLQGRFNLNNSHFDEELNTKLDQLRRLFTTVLFDVDENRINQIIQSIVDHVINEQDQLNPFFHISQLRMLDGVTAEVYQQINPYLTVLPEPTAININTAAPPVLMSLSPEISTNEVDALIESRQNTPFTSIETFMNTVSGNLGEVEADMITFESQYFLLSSEVLINEQRLNTFTVFHLANDGGLATIRILWRSVGTI